MGKSPSPPHLSHQAMSAEPRSCSARLRSRSLGPFRHRKYSFNVAVFGEEKQKQQIQGLIQEVNADKSSLNDLKVKLSQNISMMVGKYDKMVQKLETISIMSQSLAKSNPIPTVAQRDLKEMEKKDGIIANLEMKCETLQEKFDQLESRCVTPETFSEILKRKDQEFVELQFTHATKVRELQRAKLVLESMSTPTSSSSGSEFGEFFEAKKEPPKVIYSNYTQTPSDIDRHVEKMKPFRRKFGGHYLFIGRHEKNGNRKGNPLSPNWNSYRNKTHKGNRGRGKARDGRRSSERNQRPLSHRKYYKKKQKKNREPRDPPPIVSQYLITSPIATNDDSNERENDPNSSAEPVQDEMKRESDPVSVPVPCGSSMKGSTPEFCSHKYWQKNQQDEDKVKKEISGPIQQVKVQAILSPPGLNKTNAVVMLHEEAESESKESEESTDSIQKNLQKKEMKEHMPSIEQNHKEEEMKESEPKTEESKDNDPEPKIVLQEAPKSTDSKAPQRRGPMNAKPLNAALEQFSKSEKSTVSPASAPNSPASGSRPPNLLIPKQEEGKPPKSKSTTNSKQVRLQERTLKIMGKYVDPSLPL